MNVIEYLDSWTEILNFIAIVKYEATLFKVKVNNIEICYNLLFDKYKVEIIYEGRSNNK